MLPILLLLPGDPAATTFAEYRAKTRASLSCLATQETGEVVVCALRNADQYRVPFTTIVAGDPKREGVDAERERYFAKTTPCQDMGPFLIGCGKVGVTATVGARGVRFETERELAP